MSELLRFDWAAKHILRDKANFGILEGFLSELLKTEITIVELLESESNREHAHDKLNRVDLLVKNSQQELILIEIQNDSEVDYFQRMLFGASKLLVEHLSKGEAYGQLKKVIAVHIVYFDLAQGKDYLYHGTTTFTGVYEHDELQLSENQRQFFQIEQVRDLYPEYYLIKVKQFQDIIRNRFDEWAYFLKHEQIKTEFQAKNIQLAHEKLDVLKLPPDERRAYHAFLENLRYEQSMFVMNRKAYLVEGKQLGLEEGLAQGKQLGLEEGLTQGKQLGLEEGLAQGKQLGLEAGLAQGRRQAQCELARTLLADGHPPDKISLYTGLSAAEISALSIP